MNLPTDPTFYIVAILAIILVGFAKGGFSGMGAASMPLLVLVMDPIKAATMLLPILIIQDVVGVWSFRKTFDRKILRWMLPGAVIGIMLGWLLATVVNADWVKGAVGVISLLFGIERLAAHFGYRLSSGGRALPEWVGILWGGVAGFTSHIAHAGGPPFQAWTIGRGMTPTIYAGTGAIFFFCVNMMKVPAYWQLGQFDHSTLSLALLFTPIAVTSTLAGVWFVRRTSPTQFQIFISILMIIVGCELIRSAVI